MQETEGQRKQVDIATQTEQCYSIWVGRFGAKFCVPRLGRTCAICASIFTPIYAVEATFRVSLVEHLPCYMPQSS